jgi:hypothetical protein
MKKKTQHTPGPWRFEQISAKVFMGDIYAPGNTRVAANVHATNAHLIAAAPELLSVLQRLAEYPTDEHHRFAIRPEDMNAIRAAIAKAKP